MNLATTGSEKRQIFQSSACPEPAVGVKQDVEERFTLIGDVFSAKLLFDASMTKLVTKLAALACFCVTTPASARITGAMTAVNEEGKRDLGGAVYAVSITIHGSMPDDEDATHAESESKAPF